MTDPGKVKQNLTMADISLGRFLKGETPEQIEEGVENLKKLRNRIDTTKMKVPSFLMAFIGVGDYVYRKQDGVYAVPPGCLKD